MIAASPDQEESPKDPRVGGVCSLEYARGQGQERELTIVDCSSICKSGR